MDEGRRVAGVVDLGRPDMHGAGRQAAPDGEVGCLGPVGRRGFQDRGVVGAGVRLDGDVGAVVLVAAQVARGRVDELPAGFGELGDLGGGPGARADLVVARPR